MTLGGFGSLGGAIVGGLLLGVAEQNLGFYVNTALIDITAYLVIVAVLVIRPSVCSARPSRSVSEGHGMSETEVPSILSMTRWRRVYYLIPVVALVIPFFANEYLLWVVNAILVYILVTVGFNLIIGNLGQLAFVSTAFFRDWLLYDGHSDGLLRGSLCAGHIGLGRCRWDCRVLDQRDGVAGNPALLPGHHYLSLRRTHAVGLSARR